MKDFLLLIALIALGTSFLIQVVTTESNFKERIECKTTTDTP